MYLPDSNAEHDLPTLHALLRENPLGTWAALADGRLTVNHIPFLLRDDGGEYGTLVGHVARANPIWKTCDPKAESIIVFHGEQAYISPSWYPSKAKHGRAVPTWNYAVVHAGGTARFVDDRDWLREQLQQLTHEHEDGLADPWQMSDAPGDYIETMLKAVVGVEIPLLSLTGKWKLGQNKSDADQAGILQHLEADGSAESQGLAARLRKTRG